jgi:hypothetical protein
VLQCVPYRRLLVVRALTMLIQLARARQQAAADPGAKTISFGRDLFAAIQHEIMESAYNHLAVGTLQADLLHLFGLLHADLLVSPAEELERLGLRKHAYW